MIDFENSSSRFNELRRQAEKLVMDRPADVDLSGYTPRKLAEILHEIEVHQIELQLQNEELRRTQNELQQTRDDYFELYDLAPVGYLTLDRDKLISRVNLTAARLLQVERSSLVKRGFSQFVKKEDHEAFYHLMQRTGQGNGQASCEVDLLPAGGAPLHVKLDCSLHEGEAGETMAYRLTITDISLIHQTRHALQRAQDLLEKRVGERTTELRTSNDLLQQEIVWRRAVEEKLRSSERRFRLLVSMSPAGIYLTDEKGLCIYVNERWCEMAGFDAQEAAGDNWLQAVHAEDRSLIESAWEHMVASGGRWQREFRFQNKNGEVVWIYGLANPIRDDGGKTTGYIGINTDITALKLAQQRLREEEEKYRTIADYACSWEYWLSPQGRYLYISPACEEVSGYTAEELAADPEFFFTIVHSEDLPVVKEHYGLELYEKQLPRLDFRIVKKDGEERWVSHACRPVYDSGGDFVGRRGSFRDITTRIHMEEELSRSEKRLRLALDASSDGVWDRNLVTGEVYYGENWHRVLGYHDEEAKELGLTWEGLMHPDDREMALAKVDEHLKGFAGRYQAEFRMRNSRGEWQWILARGQVVDWDEGGRPLRFVGTHTDITYRKHFEQELFNAHGELEKKFTARTREIEETNLALNVLMRKLKEDKRELEQHISANFSALVEPYLDKLDRGASTGGQKMLLDILRANLAEILAPFTDALSSKLIKLTPAEIQVANLVKQGMRTKEIAEVLNLSPGTINIHRKNIRRKLGLTGQGANLQTVLSSLT